MIVYRIEREKYLPTTLSGIGASLSSHFRWNGRFTQMVYTSSSRALATLEVAVHLDLHEDLPTDRFYVEIEIPQSVVIMELFPEDLPVNWNFIPPLPNTQILGDFFIQEAKAAVLKVPSVIVPVEHNYLINPLHPDAKKIRVIATERMSFDPRFKQ